MRDSPEAPLFPQQRWAELRAAFDALMDLAPGARAQSLLDIAERDGDLADSLRALLAEAGGESMNFMESMHASPAETQEAPPERVGPFRLRQRIGTGGMGVVFLAERENADFVQRVAVKLIESGTAGLKLLAARERRILATLAHPNITAFVDAGIEQGRAWIAMEYVDGASLLDYCSAHEVDARERVRLFDQVCAAVAHAHTQLVVHRDLKPSNVLVNRDGVAKLLDFGIALALDSQDDSAPATRIFTPEYAAPEQLRGERATTASDVYALGLILYELVAGHRLPILDRATRDADWSVAELARLALAAGGDGASAAAPASADHREFCRLLRGDLGRIIAHALNPQASQRYPSVASLREDLARWLEFRPLTIRRPGVLYVARRFARRHRLGVALALCAVLAVLGLAVEAVWQARAKTLEAARAQTALRQSQATLDFVNSIFLSTDPYEGKGLQTTAGELLAAARKRIDSELGDEPEVAAALLHQVGNVYVSLGDNEATRDALGKALEYNARSAQPSPRLDAAVRGRLAYINFMAGHGAQDRRLLDEAVQQLRAMGTMAGVELALVLQMQGNVLFGENRKDEAVTAYGESVRILRSSPDASPRDYLLAVVGYADLLASLERHEEVLVVTGQGLAHPYMQLPQGAALRQGLLGSRARGLAGLRRYVEAEATLSQVIERISEQFGFEHSQARYWRYRRVQVLDWMGRLDDARVEIDALLNTPASSDEHPMASIAHRVEALNIDEQRRVGDLGARLQAARASACDENGAPQFCARVKLIDAESAMRAQRMGAAHVVLDACGADAVIRADGNLAGRCSLLQAALARHERRFDEARSLLEGIRANPTASQETIADADVEAGYLALARGDGKAAVEALRRGRASIAQSLARLTPQVGEIDAAIARATQHP
jgi:serine/threonine protein kinase